MRIKLKPIAIVLCLTGVITAPAYATVSTSNSVDIEKLSSQTQMLMTEVSRLEKEVSSLKEQNINNEKEKKETKAKIHSVLQQKGAALKKKAAAANGSAANTADPTDSEHDAPVRLNRKELIKLISEEEEYLPFDLDVPGQAFVSTGPYVGVPIQFAGSELVVNTPSVNTDVQLLTIRKTIHKQLLAMGGEIFAEPYHSHLLLSGVVEAQANYTKDGGSPSTSYIDVTNVSLDAFFIGPSPWTLGFIEFSYNNGPPSDSFYTVSNSSVYVNKAFITIGDFYRSPFYGTVGQFYVPFGQYASMMISDTLPKLIARTKARAILLGYQQQTTNALYASTYVFRGDSYAAGHNRVNNGGINLGYRFNGHFIHGDVGGGIIGNIADSGGMQDGNGFSQFEKLAHRVPAYNLRTILGFGEHVDFIGEFISATTAFNSNDMSFNGRGARPWAFDTQLAYSFMILDNKPSNIGVGYAKSHDALSLDIPTTRYSIVFNTSLWRNTLQSLEFRHDKNYASSATANGPVGAEDFPGQCTSATCASTSQTDNAVTAQFDYYF